MLIVPPRTSWLYRFALSLSSTRRYLVTLLFITICSVLWFHYIYEPLHTRIEAAQQQIKMPRSPSMQELTDTIAALRAELATPTSTASRDDQLHAILGYIDHAGMMLEQCAMQDKTIMVQALGSYTQIQTFFEELAASTQRLMPRDVRITRGSDDRYCLSVVLETM